MKTNALTPVRTGRRAGFTLVELLVVVSIMAVLVGLGFVALMKFRANTTNDAVKSQVKRLQLALNQEYATVLAKCQKDPVPDAVIVYCGGDRERAKAVHTAATLRVNFPETFTEASTPSFSIGALYEQKVSFKPVWNNTGGSAAEQSAVLLYLILKEKSIGGGGGEEGGSTGEIKTVNLGGKDFSIFVDVRGAPVSFKRWAQTTELDNPPYATVGSPDPLDPKKLVINWTPSTQRDALNAAPYNLQFNGRNRVPSVVGWGDNKTFDNLSGDDVLGYQFNRQGN
ncbi:type II secretion system protein [Gemmata sp. G18]|uniref:Type II secretion system protein n=1 Tax=Gemmata palustris TaxID=2822762 RepID=A0ABS5BXM6_9BACT|nr:type II secretion system protein [Gemmata palustris]MBP3958492.1 type II secretion system protein [Gemmata palustris]